MSWENSEDGIEWTVKLRQGVTFHDGKPFNADAVAKHFNRILDPENKARARAFITAVQEAVVVDEHTVKFILKHPWHGFLPMLAGRDMAGLIESPDQTATGKQNREPIGTGPFVFKEWRGGDRLIVTKNPNYWDKDKIHLDQIVYRILPDPQTRFQSLLAGDVDVIWTDRGSSINQAKKNKDVVVYEQEGAGSGLFLLNASAPPLDDSAGAPSSSACIEHTSGHQGALEEHATLMRIIRSGIAVPMTVSLSTTRRKRKLWSSRLVPPLSST